MVSQKKHHYVPHFYLKHFASIPRRINILNLKDYHVGKEIRRATQAKDDDGA